MSKRSVDDVSPTRDLIDLYAAHLRSLDQSPRTIQTRHSALRLADRRLPYGLEQACEEEIRSLLFDGRLSRKSRATYLAAYKSFYRFCVGRYLDSDPTENIPPPRVNPGVPRPVTDDQLRIILTRASEPYRLWATLAAYLGARCIEISRLDREHVTERVTYLHGKGDKPRAVPTHRNVWTVVQSLPSGPIALTPTGSRADAQHISVRSWVHFHRKLNLDVSMHRLRHWFLTNAHRAFRDIRITQQLAGHSSPTTTAIYTQVADADARQAVEMLPNVIDDGLDASA